MMFGHETLADRQAFFLSFSQDAISADQVVNFINQLKIFKIGMSWGGINSLALVYPDLQRPAQDFGGRIVRLNIGLEKVGDLTDDLAQAMAQLS
jgi:cystathionine beta-lyase